MTRIMDRIREHNDGSKGYFRSAIMGLHPDEARQLVEELDGVISSIETDLEWRSSDEEWERRAISALKANKTNLSVAKKVARGKVTTICVMSEKFDEALSVVMAGADGIPEGMNESQTRDWAQCIIRAVPIVKSGEGVSTNRAEIVSARIKSLNYAHTALRTLRQDRTVAFERRFVDAAKLYLSIDDWSHLSRIASA